MAAKNTTATKGTRTKKEGLSNTSIVVLETHVGHDLLIRSNPSNQDVRSFAEEHHRRYLTGEPGGPSRIPAYRLFNARRYATEEAYLAGEQHIDEIDLSDLLATP